MAQYMTWYRLQLLVYCKRPGFWLEFLVLAVLLGVLHFMQIPQGNNVRIAVCSPSYELSDEASSFVIVSYENEEQVVEAVRSGKADCGFLIPEDIEERIASGSERRSITCVTTPLSTKAAIARESISAQLFPLYSNRLLQESLDDWDPQGEHWEEIRQENARLLQSDELFEVDWKVQQVSDEKELPVRRLAALAVVLLAMLHRIWSERKKMLPYYRGLTCLAMVTPLLPLLLI
jgi:hypothetical protein